MTRSRILYTLTVLVCAVALTGTAFAAGPDQDRYIVKFADESQGRAALDAAGASVLLELPEVGAAAVRIPSSALAGLEASPAFEYIEVDAPRYPMAQITPYGIPMVQADQVSDANAANRTVCIIDSGYDLGHEDLDGDGSVTGTNDSGTGNWYEDTCSHGTHVAGTVSALNNTVGVLGVNSSGTLNLHIIKVFDGSDCAWSYSSDLVDAAYACRDAGANVISMSLGCTGRFCASTTEDNAFNDLFTNYGILSVAAAGNSGNTQYSYPASYDSVVSVAAVDEFEVVADFSQQNDQVELAGPGVGVLSTVVRGTGFNVEVTVGTTAYEAAAMQETTLGTATGALVDCGDAGAFNTGTACNGTGGHVCLIERGTISFEDKVLNCEASGGVAAIIYNNVAGMLFGTLSSPTATTIPAVGTSDTNGAAMLNQLGESTTVTVEAGDYDYFSGTSMATPHVSGVAALVWSHDTTWTNQQIRDALAGSAKDLGAAGYDNAYGHGLVQAAAALDLLVNGGGGDGGTTDPISLTASGRKVRGVHVVDLSWSGATSTDVDVFRNGSLITTTANDGEYTDNTGNKGGATYDYQVCEAGTTTCSNIATVTF